MCPQATNFFLFPPAGTSRQYNDGDMIQCGPVSNSAQDFDPIVFRQMQVQQDDPWTGVHPRVPLIMDEFERLRPIRDDVQIKFLYCLVFQRQPEEFDIRRVIVYEENLRRKHVWKSNTIFRATMSRAVVVSVACEIRLEKQIGGRERNLIPLTVQIESRYDWRAFERR